MIPPFSSGLQKSLVDFRDLHEDVLLHKFNVQSLLAWFSLVEDSKISAGGDTKLSDATNPGGNNTKKEGSKRKSGNEDNENKGNKKRFGPVENKDQVPEFKMMEGEKWKNSKENAFNLEQNSRTHLCALASIRKELVMSNANLLHPTSLQKIFPLI